MALPEEIAIRLSSQSVGSTSANAAGWLLTAWEFHPSTANDQQIAIVPTGGYQAEIAEGTTHLTKPTFQTLIRGPARGSTLSSTALVNKVDDVVTALNLYTGTLGGHQYLDIQLQGEPSYIGRDENQRAIFSANWLAFRSRTSG